MPLLFAIDELVGLEDGYRWTAADLQRLRLRADWLDRSAKTGGGGAWSGGAGDGAGGSRGDGDGGGGCGGSCGGG